MLCLTLACGTESIVSEGGKEASADIDVSVDAAEDVVADEDVAPEVAVDAGCGAAGYHDMTSPSCWSTFDTTSVSTGASGFAGGAFALPPGFAHGSFF